LKVKGGHLRPPISYRKKGSPITFSLPLNPLHPNPWNQFAIPLGFVLGLIAGAVPWIVKRRKHRKKVMPPEVVRKMRD